MTYATRFAATVLVALLLTLAAAGTPAWAGGNADALLKGDYYLSLTQVCSLGGPAGFTDPPDLQPIQGFAPIVPIILTGTLSYNGDGTGTFEGTSLPLFPGPQPPSGLRQDQFTCNTTYSVGADRGVSQQFACVALPLTGPLAGIPFNVDFEVQGQLGQGRQTVVFGDTDINQETLTTPVPVKRICGRAGAAQKIKKGGQPD